MTKGEFVVVLVYNLLGELLVIEHHDENRRGLNFPGGKVDPGETPEQAVVREAWEEAGIVVSNLRLISEGDHVFHGVTWRGYFYLAGAYTGTPRNREPSKHISVRFRDCAQIERKAERPFVVELLDLAARARHNGFIVRNDPRLVIVPNWAEFVEWAKDGGYGEAYLDINDSRCMHLQEQYLAELSALEASEGSRAVGGTAEADAT